MMIRSTCAHVSQDLQVVDEPSSLSRVSPSRPGCCARKAVSSGELVELYLERIERHQPAAQRLHRRLRRPRARRRRMPPTSGSRRERRAAARRAGRLQGRARHRGPGRRARDPRLRRTAGRAPTPRTGRGCGRPARSCSRRRRCPSSRSAASPRPRPGARPATRGTPATPRAAPAAAPAAAVAAGLVGAASASDGGGSIRIPAANCGLFGLKPQRGRISLAPDPEHWLGLTSSGCLSRRVADTALWLDVAAGPAPGDAGSAPRRSRAASPRRQRASPAGCGSPGARALPGRWRRRCTTPRVDGGVAALADRLAGLGHRGRARAIRTGVWSAPTSPTST